MDDKRDVKTIFGTGDDNTHGRIMPESDPTIVQKETAPVMPLQPEPPIVKTTVGTADDVNTDGRIISEVNTTIVESETAAVPPPSAELPVVKTTVGKTDEVQEYVTVEEARSFRAIKEICVPIK